MPAIGRQGATYVTGLRETVRNLEKLGTEVDDLKDAFHEIGEVAAGIMRGYIPTGPTGKLRASVRANRAKNSVRVTVGNNLKSARGVRYAGPINFGWTARGIRADDFTGDTDKDMEPRTVDLLSEQIGRLINQLDLGD